MKDVQLLIKHTILSAILDENTVNFINLRMCEFYEILCVSRIALRIALRIMSNHPFSTGGGGVGGEGGGQSYAFHACARKLDDQPTR